MTGVRLKSLCVQSATITGVALAAVAPAAAQSVNDYRLPTAPPTNPRAQGPVTPDNPVILAPRPSASATAAPPPPPAPAPAATRTAAPVARPVTPTSTAPRTGTQPPAPRPSQAAPAASAPVQDPGASLGLPPLTPASSAPTYAPPPAIATAPAESRTGSWPLVAGGLAALFVIVGGLLFWRRRQSETAEPVVEFVPPIVTAPAPDAEPIRAPNPAVPAALPVSPPTSEPADPPRGIALAVEAKRMSASLMATTLSYKLTLTNHTDTPLSAVAIEGDMIAAQAQVPQERQVAMPTQPLEGRFQISELAPGESAEFTGDIRVPLNTIVPIRAGTQALFIPLARFRVEAGRGGSGRMAVTRTWVVGEEPETPGAPLKPFRLDLGPRTYSRLGQRPVN